MLGPKLIFGRRQTNHNKINFKKGAGDKYLRPSRELMLRILNL